MLALMSERIRTKTAPDRRTLVGAALVGESSVASKAREPMGTNAAKVTRWAKAPQLDEQEEQILREAIKYLLFNHGHLLVPARIRADGQCGARRWVNTVHLRYPTGFEGEIGELLYDGAEFTFLTPSEVRRQRAQKIADDAEGIRQWNELQASALPPGET
jgi:hypothetical protein